MNTQEIDELQKLIDEWRRKAKDQSLNEYVIMQLLRCANQLDGIVVLKRIEANGR